MLMTEGQIYGPGCTQRSASALTSRPAQGERDQPGAINHIELKSENDNLNGANFAAAHESGFVTILPLCSVVVLAAGSRSRSGYF
jgi:hypothetical protein